MPKFILILVLGASAFAQSAPSSLLPANFAGWQKGSDGQVIQNPGAYDPQNAAALKEFGFTGGEISTYTRADRKINVKAARFTDATGGYGTFTLYQSPDMVPEKLCDGGASAVPRVVFYCGNVLLDVTLDKVTAMSSSELRQLAAAIPKLKGNEANRPTLPLYLPREMHDDAKLAVGPASLAASGSPIPAELVDFGRSAEVAVGRFQRTATDGIVTLISYPTPQIATAQLKRIEDWRHSQPNAGGTFETKRTGPMVAVVTGDLDPKQAQNLLADINYDAEVTWSEPTGMGKRENIGNLIYQVFILIGIILGITLVMGLAFGGFRIMLRNTLSAKRRGTPEEADFISLNLRE